MSATDPNYYRGAKWQSWDVIEMYHMGFLLGNAFKYLVRAGNKNDLKEDLEKAVVYLRKFKDTHLFVNRETYIDKLLNCFWWSKSKDCNNALSYCEDIVCDLTSANNLSIQRKNCLRTVLYIAVFNYYLKDKRVINSLLEQLIEVVRKEIADYEAGNV